jgi:hypothetical protein
VCSDPGHGRPVIPPPADRPASDNFKIFSLDGGFVGTLHLIRDDLLQRPALPTDGRALLPHCGHRVLEVRTLLVIDYRDLPHARTAVVHALEQLSRFFGTSRLVCPGNPLALARVHRVRCGVRRSGCPLVASNIAHHTRRPDPA